MTSKTFHMVNQLEAVDTMVQTLRAEVDTFLSPETCFRFEICLSETLTNLAIHAKAKTSDVPVEIGLTIESKTASVEIFDPLGVQPFDLRNHAKDLAEVDTLAEGGRGLGLIMECADEVNYGPTGSRNRLSLIFRDQT